MLEPGDVLQSRYDIEAIIGQGGMGRVYRARQSFLGRRLVAIKEICLHEVPEPARPDAVIGFLREAETLARLHHPNLIRVHDCFEDEGQVFLVMEFVDGWTLDEVLDHHAGGVPLDLAIDWVQQLCNVLTYLHTRCPRIVFRDLKPSNIMVDSGNLVRLIDFGIVEWILGERGDTGRPLQGTAGYASLEQMIDTERMADPRIDIYGLGATLYHLLTGQCPVDAVARMVGEELPSPQDKNPLVPRWLSDLVLQTMALRWEDRIGSAAEVRTCIELHRHQPIESDVTSVRAWWRSTRGGLHVVEVVAAMGDCISFSAFGVRKVPNDMYFRIPQYAEPFKVRLRVLQTTEQGDHLTCIAQMLEPPPALMALLQQALRPEACNNRKLKRRWERVEVQRRVVLVEMAAAGQTLDLSTGGMRMMSPYPLRLGTRPTMYVLLDDVILPDLELQAEVRWCKATWDGGYECGLSWSGLDERSGDVLRLFLEQMVAQRALPV